MMCVICLGCQGLAGVERREAAEQGPRGLELWEEGQEAMKAGQPAQAIVLYQQSLAQDARLKQNHLSLAAAYLEKGEDRLACEHLGLFLQAQPGHRTARFYHAELLRKLSRHAEARDEFERAIRYAQEEAKPDLKHLVHCHGRLTEVGEVLEDDYLVHLHRGIGLYLLARQRAALPEPDGELCTEALLCKATAELSRARSLRPQEARPSWYLHEAWRQLGQHEPARRRLREASRAAPFSYLTPAEQRDLMLACRERLEPAPH
jgi:tetratricopeptide (TPR) repeat protein